MATGRIRSLTAAIAITALVWVFCAPVAQAGVAASWGGRVFHPDRITPRQGVVVGLADDRGDAVLLSKPTRDDGSFMIDGAQPGTYKLTVETPEGVFVSSEPLRLDGGVNKPMALALNAMPINAKQEHGLGGDNPSRTKEFIFAGIITLFALLVILEITDDVDENPASLQ